MGRLLAALIGNCETVSAANPANVANLWSTPQPIFADSQESHGAPIGIRTRLHRLATDAGLTASVVDAIGDDEVTLYDCGLSDLTLRDCLRARALNSPKHPAYRNLDKANTP